MFQLVSSITTRIMTPVITNISGFISLPASTGVELPASSEFFYDYTNSSCYSGSGQTVNSIVTNPASGALQSDYGKWLGSSDSVATDDPTFAGTAGTANAKFQYGGDDFFVLKNITTFTATLGRSDQSNNWWAASHFYLGTSGSLYSSIFATASSAAAEHGVALVINESLSRIELWLRNASGSTSMVAITADGSIPGNTSYLVIFGYNSSTGDWSIYLNSKSITASGTLAPVVSTTNSVDALGVGGGGGGTGGSRFANGSEQYQFGMGNTALTSGIVSDVVDFVNNSSGTSY